MLDSKELEKHVTNYVTIRITVKLLNNQLTDHTITLRLTRIINPQVSKEDLKSQ